MQYIFPMTSNNETPANQASYLLGRQLKRLEQQFASDGGFTDWLYSPRKGQRSR